MNRDKIRKINKEIKILQQCRAVCKDRPQMLSNIYYEIRHRLIHRDCLMNDDK